MELSPAIVSALAAAVCVPLFMALMRRIKIFRHRPDASKSFAQLAGEYQKWELLSVLLGFVLVAFISFVIQGVLEMIYARQLSYQEPGLFVLGLQPIVWWIPALFFALFIAAIPLHYLFLAMLGRRRYAEYIEYGNQKFEINSWRVFRFLRNLMLPLCMVLTFMALDTYARVTNDRFVVNRFLEIGETAYHLDHLQTIVLVKSFAAPGGNIVRRPHYVLRFQDGSEFDFHTFPAETDFQQQQSLVGFLVDATGLTVIEEDPYPV